MMRKSQERSSAIRISRATPALPWGGFGVIGFFRSEKGGLHTEPAAFGKEGGRTGRSNRRASGNLVEIARYLGVVDIGAGHDGEAGPDRGRHGIAGGVGVGDHEAKIADLRRMLRDRQLEGAVLQLRDDRFGGAKPPGFILAL